MTKSLAESCWERRSSFSCKRERGGGPYLQTRCNNKKEINQTVFSNTNTGR